MRRGSLNTFQIFLVMAVLIIGIFLVVINFPLIFGRKGCKEAQEEKIANILIEAKGMADAGTPGYNFVYFTVKECARSFSYDTTKEISGVKGALKVHYKIGGTGVSTITSTTTDPATTTPPSEFDVYYSSPTIWDGEEKLNNNEGKDVTHTLQIYTDKIVVVE